MTRVGRRVGVSNATRGTSLHPAAELAAGVLERTLGFMFRDPRGRAIVFDLRRTVRVTLHTFFVRGALDVVVLDDRLEIVAQRRGLAPFSEWSADRPGRWLVEFEAGVLERTATATGDRLAFAFG